MGSSVKGPTLRAGSLFSGIGGFCLGFQSAGIQTAWAVENDPFASATYRANFPETTLFEREIQTIHAMGDDLEPVDILHAGFPCQSFSQAGARKGFEDPRGRLFHEIIRIVSDFKDRRPKAIVLENTPNLRNGEGGAWFLEIQKEIQKAGYWFRDTNCAELNAFDITELPQQRTRLFMVAFSIKNFRSGRFSFPVEKSAQPKHMENFIDFTGTKDDEYYLHHENRYYKMINRKVSDSKCIYQLRKYVVRAQNPGSCPTLTANMGLGGHNVPFIVDDRGLRKLTEYECLRLQGFSQDFRFPDEVPRARRYTQVGNSVAAPVAELLALKVIDKFQQEIQL